MAEMSRQRTFDYALDLLKASDSDALRAFAAEAVERFPKDAELRLINAIALLPSRPVDARWETARAVELNADDPGLLTRAARLMLDLGDVESADGYARRATGLKQANFAFASDLHNVTGAVAAIRGESELAERELRSAHEAEPAREAFARDLTTFLRGLDRTKEAALVLDRTLAETKDPDALDALRALRRKLSTLDQQPRSELPE